MSGFESKRQETQDFLRAEEDRLTRWETELAMREQQHDAYREWALAVFALIGLAGSSAAAGFYFGVMYAVAQRAS